MRHIYLIFPLILVNVLDVCHALKLVNNSRAKTKDDSELSKMEEDLHVALNDSEDARLPFLLQRYPDLLQVVMKVINETMRTNNSESLEEDILCSRVKMELEKTQDACLTTTVSISGCENIGNSNATATKPPNAFLCAEINTTTPPIYTTSVSTVKKNATTTRIINILSTTVKRTTSAALSTRAIMTSAKHILISSNLTNKRNFTFPKLVKGRTISIPKFGILQPKRMNIPFPKKTTSQVASSYLLLAIQIIAKTAMISFERRCKERNGTYNSKSNACLIRQSDNANGTGNHTIWGVVGYSNSRDGEAMNILSLCGNICSLVGIFLLFLGYGVCNKQLSLFHKNILCLSLMLFISHILQLFIQYFGQAMYFCKSSGILLHWALVSSFLWMLAISYDIFKTFTGIHRVDYQRSRRRFKKYVAIVMTTATAIILACVVIGIPEEDYSGYGYNGKCFVAKFWANLFGFTLPVAIVLLLNATLMTITLIKLRSAQKQSLKISLASSRKGRSSRKKIIVSFLMLKLSILFGLGWLFGFLAGVTESSFLPFIFTMIVSFQGFLVYLSFGCHKKHFISCYRKLSKVEVESTYRSSKKVTETVEI